MRKTTSFVILSVLALILTSSAFAQSLTVTPTSATVGGQYPIGTTLQISGSGWNASDTPIDSARVLLYATANNDPTNPNAAFSFTTESTVTTWATDGTGNLIPGVNTVITLAEYFQSGITKLRIELTGGDATNSTVTIRSNEITSVNLLKPTATLSNISTPIGGSYNFLYTDPAPFTDSDVAPASDDGTTNITHIQIDNGSSTWVSIETGYAAAFAAHHTPGNWATSINVNFLAIDTAGGGLGGSTASNSLIDELTTPATAGNIKVRMRIVDSAGNEGFSNELSGLTVDPTPPSYVSCNTASTTTIRVVFTEEVVATTGDFVIDGGTYAVTAVNVGSTVAEKILTVSPAMPSYLKPAVEVKSTIRDLAFNTLANPGTNNATDNVKPTLTQALWNLNLDTLYLVFDEKMEIAGGVTIGDFTFSGGGAPDLSNLTIAGRTTWPTTGSVPAEAQDNAYTIENISTASTALTAGDQVDPDGNNDSTGDLTDDDGNFANASPAVSVIILPTLTSWTYNADNVGELTLNFSKVMTSSTLTTCLTTGTAITFNGNGLTNQALILNTNCTFTAGGNSATQVITITDPAIDLAIRTNVGTVTMAIAASSGIKDTQNVDLLAFSAASNGAPPTDTSAIAVTSVTQRKDLDITGGIVDLVFNDFVHEASAETITNYLLTAGTGTLGANTNPDTAVRQADGKTVRLTFSPVVDLDQNNTATITEVDTIDLLLTNIFDQSGGNAGANALATAITNQAAASTAIASASQTAGSTIAAPTSAMTPMTVFQFEITDANDAAHDFTTNLTSMTFSVTSGGTFNPAEHTWTLWRVSSPETQIATLNYAAPLLTPAVALNEQITEGATWTYLVKVALKSDAAGTTADGDTFSVSIRSWATNPTDFVSTGGSTFGQWAAIVGNTFTYDVVASQLDWVTADSAAVGGALTNAYSETEAKRVNADPTNGAHPGRFGDFVLNFVDALGRLDTNGAGNVTITASAATAPTPTDVSAHLNLTTVAAAAAGVATFDDAANGIRFGREITSAVTLTFTSTGYAGGGAGAVGAFTATAGTYTLEPDYGTNGAIVTETTNPASVASPTAYTTVWGLTVTDQGSGTNIDGLGSNFETLVFSVSMLDGAGGTSITPADFDWQLDGTDQNGTTTFPIPLTYAAGSPGTLTAGGTAGTIILGIADASVGTLSIQARRKATLVNNGVLDGSTFIFTVDPETTWATWNSTDPLGTNSTRIAATAQNPVANTADTEVEVTGTVVRFRDNVTPANTPSLTKYPGDGATTVGGSTVAGEEWTSPTGGENPIEFDLELVDAQGNRDRDNTTGITAVTFDALEAAGANVTVSVGTPAGAPTLGIWNITNLELQTPNITNAPTGNVTLRATPDAGATGDSNTFMVRNEDDADSTIATQVAPSNIALDPTDTTTWVDVWTLRLTDTGLSDGKSTVVTGMTFNVTLGTNGTNDLQDFTWALRTTGGAIINSSPTVSAAGTGTVVFSGLTITAADGGTSDFVLSIRPGVFGDTTNVDNMTITAELDVSTITAPSATTLSTAFTGGADIVPGTDIANVEVTATTLDISADTPGFTTTTLGDNFPTAFTIYYEDSVGYRDLDATAGGGELVSVTRVNPAPDGTTAVVNAGVAPSAPGVVTITAAQLIHTSNVVFAGGVQLRFKDNTAGVNVHPNPSTGQVFATTYAVYADGDSTIADGGVGAAILDDDAFHTVATLNVADLGSGDGLATVINRMRLEVTNSVAGYNTNFFEWKVIGNTNTVTVTPPAGQSIVDFDTGVTIHSVTDGTAPAGITIQARVIGTETVAGDAENMTVQVTLINLSEPSDPMDTQGDIGVLEESSTIVYNQTVNFAAVPVTVVEHSIAWVSDVSGVAGANAGAEIQANSAALQTKFVSIKGNLATATTRTVSVTDNVVAWTVNDGATVGDTAGITTYTGLDITGTGALSGDAGNAVLTFTVDGAPLAGTNALTITPFDVYAADDADSTLENGGVNAASIVVDGVNNYQALWSFDIKDFGTSDGHNTVLTDLILTTNVVHVTGVPAVTIDATDFQWVVGFSSAGSGSATAASGTAAGQITFSGLMLTAADNGVRSVAGGAHGAKATTTTNITVWVRPNPATAKGAAALDWFDDVGFQNLAVNTATFTGTTRGGALPTWPGGIPNVPVIINYSKLTIRDNLTASSTYLTGIPDALSGDVLQIAFEDATGFLDRTRNGAASTLRVTRSDTTTATGIVLPTAGEFDPVNGIAELAVHTSLIFQDPIPTPVPTGITLLVTDVDGTPVTPVSTNSFFIQPQQETYIDAGPAVERAEINSIDGTQYVFLDVIITDDCDDYCDTVITAVKVSTAGSTVNWADAVVHLKGPDLAGAGIQGTYNSGTTTMDFDLSGSPITLTDIGDSTPVSETYTIEVTLNQTLLASAEGNAFKFVLNRSAFTVNTQSSFFDTTDNTTIDNDSATNAGDGDFGGVGGTILDVDFTAIAFDVTGRAAVNTQGYLAANSSPALRLLEADAFSAANGYIVRYVDVHGNLDVDPTGGTLTMTWDGVGAPSNNAINVTGTNGVVSFTGADIAMPGKINGTLTFTSAGVQTDDAANPVVTALTHTLDLIDADDADSVVTTNSEIAALTLDSDMGRQLVWTLNVQDTGLSDGKDTRIDSIAFSVNQIGGVGNSLSDFTFEITNGTETFTMNNPTLGAGTVTFTGINGQIFVADNSTYSTMTALGAVTTGTTTANADTGTIKLYITPANNMSNKLTVDNMQLDIDITSIGVTADSTSFTGGGAINMSGNVTVAVIATQLAEIAGAPDIDPAANGGMGYFGLETITFDVEYIDDNGNRDLDVGAGDQASLDFVSGNTSFESGQTATPANGVATFNTTLGTEAFPGTNPDVATAAPRSFRVTDDAAGLALATSNTVNSTAFQLIGREAVRANVITNNGGSVNSVQAGVVDVLQFSVVDLNVLATNNDAMPTVIETFVIDLDNTTANPAAGFWTLAGPGGVNGLGGTVSFSPGAGQPNIVSPGILGTVVTNDPAFPDGKVTFTPTTPITIGNGGTENFYLRFIPKQEKLTVTQHGHQWVANVDTNDFVFSNVGSRPDSTFAGISANPLVYNVVASELRKITGKDAVSGTAGADFATTGSEIQYEATDVFGNRALGFSEICTATILNTYTSNTGVQDAVFVSSTSSVAFNQGFVSFDNLRIDRAGTGYTIQMSTATGGTQTTASFDIVPATATKVVVNAGGEAPVGNVVAGTSFNTAVSIQDDYGNTRKTDITTSVTMSVFAGPSMNIYSGGAGTPPVTATAVASSGIATFNNFNVQVADAVTTYRLQWAATGLTSAVSPLPGFTVIPADATQIIMDTTVSLTQIAGDPFNINAHLEDPFGNETTDTGVDVSLTFVDKPASIAFGYFGANTATTSLTGTTTNGAVTFAAVTIQKAGSQTSATDGYILRTTVTEAAHTALNATADTNEFQIIAAAATKMRMLTQPADPSTAGVDFSAAIQLQDQYDNDKVLNGGGVDVTVALDTVGAVLLPGLTAATLERSASASMIATTSAAGVATFSDLFVERAGQDYQLSFTASVTGTLSSEFDINPAPWSQIVITTDPTVAPGGSIVAGDDITLEAQLRDAFDNDTANGAGGVGANASLLSGPAGASLFVGTDADPSDDTPSANVNAVVNAATGEVAIDASVDMNARVASSLTSYVLRLTASDVSTTATDDTTTFFITPAASNKLVVTSTLPTSMVAGATMTQVTAEVRDIYENPTKQSGLAATARLNDITDAYAGAPAIVIYNDTTDVNGEVQFAAIQVLKTTNPNTPQGFDLILNIAALPNPSVVTSQFEVVPGTATQLVIDQSPADGQSRGGEAFDVQPVLSLYDDNDNLCYNNSSSLISASLILPSPAPAGAQLRQLDISGNPQPVTAVMAVEGVVTFTNLSVNTAATGYQLQFTSQNNPVLTSVPSTPFDVIVGAPRRLQITTQPAGHKAGAPYVLTTQPVVRLHDLGGNIAAGNGSEQVVASVVGGTASTLGANVVGHTNAIATYTNLQLDQAGSHILQFAIQGVAGSEIQSNSFTLLAGPMLTSISVDNRDNNPTVDALDVLYLHFDEQLDATALAGITSIGQALGQASGYFGTGASWMLDPTDPTTFIVTLGVNEQVVQGSSLIDPDGTFFRTSGTTNGDITLNPVLVSAQAIDTDTYRPFVTSYALSFGGTTVLPTDTVRDGVITITANYTDVQNSAPMVSIQEPGGSTVVNMAMMTGSGRSWSYDYSILTAFGTMQDGIYFVTVTGEDDLKTNAFDSTAGATANTQFITDTADPVFTSLGVTSLDGDNVYTTAESIDFVANMGGESGLMLTMNLSSMGGGASVMMTENTPGTYQLNTAAAGFSNGTHVVTATATDAAGNSSSLSTVVVIDGTAPTGSVSYNLPQNAVPAAAGTMLISIAFSEDMQAAPTIDVGGGEATGQMNGSVGGRNFTFNLPLGGLTAGVKTVAVSGAFDIAGNAVTTLSNNSFTLVAGGSVQLRADASRSTVKGLTAASTMATPTPFVLDGTLSTGASTFSWAQLPGAPETLTIMNGNTNKAEVMPTKAGTYVFELTVTRTVGTQTLTATDRTQVTVLNVQPMVNAGQTIHLAYDDYTVGTGGVNYAKLGLRGSFFDVNNDAAASVQWVASANNTGNLMIESPNSISTNLMYSGDANTAIEPGVYEFTLFVYDQSTLSALSSNPGSLTVSSGTVRVVVMGPSFATPTAHAGLNQVVQAGTVVTLSGNESSHPLGLPLTYSWSLIREPAASSIGVSGIDPDATNNGRFASFTPLEVGVYEAELTVSVNIGGSTFSTTDSVIITVNDEAASNAANRARMVRAEVKTSFEDTNDNGLANTNEVITLDASGTVDVNKNGLDFTWTQLSGPRAIVFSDRKASMQTFTPTVAGAYRFSVTVLDADLNEGTSAEARVIVVTGNAQTKAVAAINPADDTDGDMEVHFFGGQVQDSGNGAVRLTAAGSTVVSGSPLYRWVQVDGPTVGIRNPNAQEMSFVPSLSRVYEFELTLIDGNVTDVTRIALAVSTFDGVNGNAVPRAIASVDEEGNTTITVNLGPFVELFQFGSDANNVASDFIFSWVQTSGPSVVIDRSGPTPRFRPPVAGTYTFQLYVDDENDISLPSEVSVEVVNVPASSGGGSGGICSLSAAHTGGSGIAALLLLSLGFVVVRRRRREEQDA